MGDLLEGAANYIENITPLWEAGCDRIFNKVMNFLDDAEEKSLKAIDKVQHSPIGAAIDQIYERNHRDKALRFILLVSLNLFQDQRRHVTSDSFPA